jgi:hypothetical protein
MHSFKGNLYAGTADDSGKVYRSPNGNAGSWSESFYSPNLSRINHFTSTNDGGGILYASAFAPFGTIGSIYKTSDGNTWTLFHASPVTVSFVEAYKGGGTEDSIYAFEYGSFGDQVRRSSYNSNDPFDTLSTWDTIFDFSSIAPYTRITSTAQHAGKLFFGTSDGTLWSYNGVNFLQNTFVGNGFGDQTNLEISAISSHGSYLYVAVRNYTTGTQIWRSNDESTWSMVVQYPDFEKVTCLISAGGSLWTGMTGSWSFNTGLVVKSTDGLSFSISDDTGFGVSSNTGQYGNFAVHGNNLYYGTENYMGGAKLSANVSNTRGMGSSTGGQIWRTCLLTPPVISIGADQVICDGTLSTFNADPGFISYLWDDGSVNQSFSTSGAGQHYIIAMDVNGCAATDTATLTIIPSPVVTITSPGAGSATVCQADSITIAGTAVSNVRNILPPFNKAANMPIANSLGNTYDTINVSGINECSCTALYSVTIDSLYHAYDMDVSLALYSPSGFFINLLNSGAGGADFIGTEFIMTGVGPVGNFGSAPYTGQFTPVDPFSSLTGTSNGNWVIQANDNYAADDGVLKGWTLKFSVADSILTYSWNPATGVTMSSSLNTSITPPASAAYVLTTTNSVGCSVTDTINLFVPSINVSTAADSLCYGMNTNLFTDGSAGTNWTPSATLDVSTGTTVLASPLTTTAYSVIDNIAGCVVSDTVLVTVNDAFTADAGLDQSVCFGDSATISASATGGTWPYIFTWNDGNSSFPGPAELVGPLNNTTYSLLVTDSFGCSVSDTAQVNVAPSTDIYGNVSSLLGTVANSSVVLYKYYPVLTHFDTVQVTTTDAAGNYHFPSVLREDYLIEVFPSASYPSLVPTYYGNSFIWSSAAIVNHYCAVNDTLNIFAVKEDLLGTGPGYLHGLILEDTGYVRAPGDPIPGVDVKLGRNPGGQMVAATETDASGEYEFANVPFGEYIIYADIPGLGVDSSYTFIVDSLNPIYNYLDYIVDSTMIHYVPFSQVGIKDAATVQSIFNVYPNPSRGEAVIEYSLTGNAQVSLGIYNLLGVKVTGLIEASQQAGIYKYHLNSDAHSLSSGVYFITLIVDESVNIHKIIITE